jgi:hypothetical protein
MFSSRSASGIPFELRHLFTLTRDKEESAVAKKEHWLAEPEVADFGAAAQ